MHLDLVYLHFSRIKLELHQEFGLAARADLSHLLRLRHLVRLGRTILTDWQSAELTKFPRLFILR